MNELLNELRIRKEKLLDIIKGNNLDAVLLSSSAQIDQRGNLRYFLDYYVSVYEEYALLDKNGKMIFIAHDGLSGKTAAKCPIVDDVLVIPDYDNAGKFIADILLDRGTTKLGLASLRSLNSQTYLQLRESAKEIVCIDLFYEVMNLRISKSEYEYRKIKEAVQLNDKCFSCFLEGLKLGESDLSALQLAQYQSEKAGTEDQYWMMSTSNKPSVDYHVQAKNYPEVIKEGSYTTIILEHSSLSGYWGETYNVISYGEPRKDLVEAYKVLADLQIDLQKLLIPGRTVGEIASYAHNELVRSGYRKESSNRSTPFSIGHGQGLDAYEPPLVVEGSTELLKENMQINLHPGITLDDGSSLNLCMCYFIHKDGAEKLTSLSDKIYTLD